jgi:hypothetical protein
LFSFDKGQRKDDVAAAYLAAIPGPGEGFVLVCPFYSDFMIRQPRCKRSGLVGPPGRWLAAGLKGSDS